MELIQAIQNSFASVLMQAILSLVLLDVVTGLISAALRGEWSWEKVADFLGRDFGVYYLSAGAFQAILPLIPNVGAVSPLGPGAAATALLASVIANTNEILGLAKKPPAQ